MNTPCPTCGRPVTENTCIEIRGALAYHVGCCPSSVGAPRNAWQAFLALLGIE